MPELPEVQTTVDGINTEVSGLRITSIWTSYNSSFHRGKNNIKNPLYFKEFRKQVLGSKITDSTRIGKNVLIHLLCGGPTSTTSMEVGPPQIAKTILIHMKMTGHFLYGQYKFTKRGWLPVLKDGPLHDPFNRHIRLVFSLSDGKQLVFSDLRKFAKIFLFETANQHIIEDLMHLGPDPTAKGFILPTMLSLLHGRKGKIKQVLMDQHVISGIGNIYSDEMLWKACIHPLSRTEKIPKIALKKLYKAMREVLSKGIDFGGDSDSDYRNIYGEPGKFQHTHNAYRRTGELCPKKDGGTIERQKIGGRSAHFCPKHQIKY